MIIGIIPARYASTRFPGKPLIEIEGQSMIRRVYERAKQSKYLSKTIVATDDERIAAHVRSFGGEVVITAPQHPSGTDRCWEAFGQIMTNVEDIKKHYVLNIQGDEPFLDPTQIDELAAVLDGTIELATQMIPVRSEAVLFDIGEAKIILNHHQEAIYFSRQVMPHVKGVEPIRWHEHHTYYRHVGMYAYRADILEQIVKLPVSLLEKAESLEQLRWIEAGYKIKCIETAFDSHCIDTPEDIEKVLRLMQASGQK